MSNVISCSDCYFFLFVCMGAENKLSLPPHKKKKSSLGTRLCPLGCPEPLYEIMRECWRDDAAPRPTFGTLQKIFLQLKKVAAIILNPDTLPQWDCSIPYAYFGLYTYGHFSYPICVWTSRTHTGRYNCILRHLALSHCCLTRMLNWRPRSCSLWARCLDLWSFSSWRYHKEY